MKIQVTFKTPDTVEEAVKEALTSASENDSLDLVGREIQEDKAYETIEKFVKFNEIITVEFDTDKGTAVVVPV